MTPQRANPSTHARRHGVLLVSAGLMTLGACNADKLTAPNADAPKVVQGDAETTGRQDLAALGAALEDATERLAPTLGDEATVSRVVMSLRQLSAALAGEDGARMRLALAGAVAALEGQRGTPNGAAIGLVLDISASMIPSSDR